MIKQISVMDTEFKKYGKVIEGYDLKEILQKMEETPCPDDVVYVASVKELEELKIAEELAEDRKSTRLNSSHSQQSRMPSSA